jgi:phosphopantothenoylcysteine decarboxylase/phosphopantothenate--cysteine ligase
MHPAEEIRGVKSKILISKKIVLGVTGSIAAVETIKLVRELIRHGAEVIPVMTKSATKIIHPDSLWFATGKKPIIELSGAAEHVSYCGRVKDPVDLLLICPCTANTISKIAYGIDDTSVTTFATTAIGSSVPILIVPAMHLSMYNHKIIQKNIEICKKAGINFLEPNIEANKAKMPSIDKIASYTIRQITKKEFINKKILIIGGPTAENIDDVRILTNKSSGKTTVALTKQAFFMGADITVWYGYASEKIPDYIDKVDFRTFIDLKKLVEKTNMKNFDYIIVCAAIADYIPKIQKGKIKSGKKDLIIQLKPAEKLLPLIRKKATKSVIVGFKLEGNKNDLMKKSKELLKNCNLDYVIGNTISGISKDSNEIWIYNNGNIIHKKDNKNNLAKFILQTIKLG